MKDVALPCLIEEKNRFNGKKSPEWDIFFQVSKFLVEVTFSLQLSCGWNTMISARQHGQSIQSGIIFGSIWKQRPRVSPSRWVWNYWCQKKVPRQEIIQHPYVEGAFSPGFCMEAITHKNRWSWLKKWCFSNAQRVDEQRLSLRHLSLLFFWWNHSSGHLLRSEPAQDWFSETSAGHVGLTSGVYPEDWHGRP